MPKIILLIFCLVISSTALASEPEPKTYGSIYLAEEQEPLHGWTFGLGYTQELRNTLLETHGFQLRASKVLSRYFQVGFETHTYLSQESSLAKTLGTKLQEAGVEQKIYNPLFSSYAIGTFTPFSGRLNFLNLSITRFELSLRLGYGFLSLREKGVSDSLIWAIAPQFYLSRSFGFEVGFQQEVVSPWNGSERNFQTQVLIGLLIGI